VAHTASICTSNVKVGAAHSCTDKNTWHHSIKTIYEQSMWEMATYKIWIQEIGADNIRIQEMGSIGWRKQNTEFHNLRPLPNIIRMTKSK